MCYKETALSLSSCIDWLPSLIALLNESVNQTLILFLISALLFIQPLHRTVSFHKTALYHSAEGNVHHGQENTRN